MPFLTIPLLAWFAIATGRLPVSPPGDGVFVVGALHGLHAQEESFGYGALRSLIERIDPHVLVLEVTPTELAARAETPGRPEYPEVIWPLLRKFGRHAVAMEPNGAMYTQMSGEASAIARGVSERSPEVAELWKAYGRATDDLLLTYWTSLARSQDERTAALARAYYTVQGNLHGTAMAAVQDRWDHHMIERAADAIRANPGRRILILCSYRNRHRFDARLREVAAGRIVDLRDWPAEGS